MDSNTCRDEYSYAYLQFLKVGGHGRLPEHMLPQVINVSLLLRPGKRKCLQHQRRVRIVCGWFLVQQRRHQCLSQNGMSMATKA